MRRSSTGWNRLTRYLPWPHGNRKRLKERHLRHSQFEPLEERHLLSINISSLTLERDTGPNNSDGTTSDSDLVGQLAGEGNLAAVTIEFDHNNDGTAEGSVVSDTEGAFGYDPAGLAYGPVTIRARALEWDGLQFVPTDWESISFTFANSNPQISGLQLVDDTETPDDLITLDGRVQAAVNDDESASEYTIHFDYNNDGVANESLEGVTDTFEHYVGDGTGYGEVTVRVRASEWDAVTESERYGNWVSLTFTLEEMPVPLPQITEVALANDVGAPTDKITSDPTLRGRAEVEGGDAGNYRIEFDLNNDNVAEQTTDTAVDGGFVHKLTNLAEGPIAARVRAGKWDGQEGVFLFGAWTTFNFTYSLSANAAPVVATLVLANDTDEPDDQITIDPALSGTVTNDNSVEAVNVEIDLNNDGTADASTTTDAEGNFSYTPTDLDFGQRTVKARAKEWDTVQAKYINGPWKTLSFTLNVDPSLLPVVSELALANDTGESDTDNETEDPTLQGKITTGLGVGAVDVEFDHNGDGTVDGSTVTDPEGNFLYEPFGLANGPVTVQVRGKSWNNSRLDYVTGPWSSISFTMVPPPQ